jgi:ATP-dependent protease HslVU (ClpYQ) peptidase subunit
MNKAIKKIIINQMVIIDQALNTKIIKTIIIIINNKAMKTTNMKIRFIKMIKMDKRMKIDKMDLRMKNNIVVGGGTTQAQGFVEEFEKKLKENNFPLKIKAVSKAKDPLHAVARGCYIAAKIL